jgi:AcrR family transcriptional regulator
MIPSDRRTEVLDGVCAVICRAGVDGTTMRAIAGELSVSPSTVGRYFADRDEALLAAFRHCLTRAGERMMTLLQHHHGLAGVREVLLTALPLDEPRRLEWCVWLAFATPGLTTTVYHNVQQQRFAEYQASVEYALRGAQSAGELSDELDPADEAVRLVALVDGLAMRMMVDPRALPPARIHHLIELALP